MSKPFKTLEDAVKYYGPIVNGKWANENHWMVMCELPTWVQLKTSKKHIYINKEMVPVFLAALENVSTRLLTDEFKSIDGCFNIRLVRGNSDAQSTHSFGLAIDLNAPQNPLGGPIQFSKEFVQCFKDVGFSWGGDFHRVDGMHFSYAWE